MAAPVAGGWDALLHGPVLPETPVANYARAWTDETRQASPLQGGEREILTGFLDWHRRTFELKCGGVASERLSEKAVPPSDLSLHGLVRHLAGVERWWFRQQFAGEHVAHLYYSDDDPDQDFESLDGDVEEALDVWRSECAESRRIVPEAGSLEQTGSRLRDGQPFSLRWLLVNLIAEYARHNGHADLLRERIDGRSGH